MNTHPRPTVLPSENEALCQYARLIFNECGLRDWNLYILDEPPLDTQALATATIDVRRHAVELRYAQQVLEYPVELRHATVHEAVHTHLNALAETVNHEVGTELGKTAFRVFWRGFERDVERATDALAEVMAKHLPLITDSDGG